MKLLFVSFLAAGLVWGGTQTVFASTVLRTGENISIDNNQSVTGDFYGLGQTVILSGEITGDTYVAGGVVTYNGSVMEDMVIVGGTVSLHASSAEDVRIVAGDVTIAEDIAGDLVVLAGKTKILSTASVGGNVLLFGNEATIEGAVTGEVLGTVDTLRIDGPIGGLVDVEVNELTLGDQAVIEKDLRYQSQHEVVRSPNAIVGGSLSRSDATVAYADASSVSAQLVIVMTLMVLVATLAMYLIARTPVTRFAERATVRPEINGLIGGLVLILLPIAILALSVSVLGILLAVIVLAMFVGLLFTALPLMSIVLGTYIARLTNARTLTTDTLPILYVIGAAFLITALLFVPVVGPVLVFTVYLVVVGSMARVLAERARR